MSKEFTIGSVVKLNSGGPSMTILSINGETITCQWFTKDNKLQKDDFSKSVLSFDEPIGFIAL